MTGSLHRGQRGGGAMFKSASGYQTDVGEKMVLFPTVMRHVRHDHFVVDKRNGREKFFRKGIGVEVIKEVPVSEQETMMEGFQPPYVRFVNSPAFPKVRRHDVVGFVRPPERRQRDEDGE
ncbi:MAG: hypothetical protein AAB389_00530 [Patescibacteria group bacterium]